MGVLTNGYRDKIGVFRTYGGSFHNNSFPQGTLGNYNLTGMKRNLTAGEGITDDKVGLPMGYVMKGWQMPQKAGMISARMHDFAISGSGTAVMGYPIEATASLSITIADATGQLISSGNGTATISITPNTPALTASIGGSGSATLAITLNVPTIGAEASISGETTLTITVANATAYPLNDASPLRDGAASFTVSGSLTPYAIGQMTGSTIDSGVLTADSITAAVWNAVLADFNTNGSAGKALATAGAGGVDLDALAQAVWEYIDRTLTSGGGGSSYTPEQIATAILTAAQTTPIHSNIQKVNDIEVKGIGTTSDPWNPVG